MKLILSIFWSSIALLCLNIKEVNSFHVAPRCQNEVKSLSTLDNRYSSSIRSKTILNEKEGNNEPEEKGLLSSIRGWMRSEEGREDINTYVVSLTVALLLRFFIIEPRFIPSLSMYPTFEVGDQLAVEKVTKLIRPFERKEVVVFNPPLAFREALYGQVNVDSATASKKAREALIKRIVAVEGDVVKIREGKLYINNEQQDEPFTAEDAAYEFGPVTVPPGQVLVLGDNRNHSLDGHIWGFLPKENVIGRAVFVYWPPWRLGNDGMF